MDSQQREGIRAWHAHIALEQSNVARIERADLLVFLVLVVLDDWAPGHVLQACPLAQRRLGAVSAARGGFFGFRPLFGTPYRDATSPDRTLCTV